MEHPMIHPTAIVSSKAEIGRNVRIGAFSCIHDNVVIGDDSTVEGYCEIGVPSPLSDGSPLSIGAGARVRSHSVFYEGSRFGDGLVTGHRVTVRERTVAGLNLQIGTLSDIQGHCGIGDYVRLHSSVFVAQESCIGSFAWLFPFVVVANDPHPPSNTVAGVTINEFAAIGARSVLLPGVSVGRDALVAAGSCVTRSVEPGTVVGGNPAKMICLAERIQLREAPGGPAYPWRRHFHRGYPRHIVSLWVDEFANFPRFE
jgi:acetyltransferase-like isoleucine patch superfamily enzyme